jgi:hypothetical protein
MELKHFFKEVIQRLKNKNLRFAIAGGLVASLYRNQERLTKDLDLLILAPTKTQEVAEKIVKSFDLKPNIIRKADLEGGPHFAVKRKNTEPYMIVGRSKDNTEIGLDFILPSMPWFEEALNRAETNCVDFGFGPIPSLKVEDVIIAKFYSANNDVTRFKDLDDLQSIFLASHELDFDYLCGQMQRLNLKVPKQIEASVPKVLLLISKKIKS